MTRAEGRRPVHDKAASPLAASRNEQGKSVLKFSTIYGVDFSGARLAGRNTWVARLERVGRGRDVARYGLKALAPLENLCGTAEREAALSHLVELIAESEGAL